MSADSRLGPLFRRWLDGCLQGAPPSIDELTSDCPEQAEPLLHLISYVCPRLEGQATLRHATPIQDESHADLGTLPTLPRSPLARDSSLPTFDGYDTIAELGRGAMGVVYHVRQHHLGREVALKMILSGIYAGATERRRFIDEARAVAAIKHPGIIQIHEFGEFAGLPYYALEYCALGSLANRLAEHPLPATEAADLVQQIALAIQSAHDAGIIHRDLKPANVLLTKDGDRIVTKVSDFGLARRVNSDARMTSVGAIVGTPSYMAPEQAAGVAKITPAVDIWALGAILYECLTGRPPFTAAGATETLLQVISQEPVTPTKLNPGIPRDLETITLKCLQKDPHRRYPHAREMAEDLRRWRDHEPIFARPVGVVERSRKWMRRNPIVALLIALVATTLILGTIVSTWFALVADRESRHAREEAEKQRQARELADDSLEQVERLLYAQKLRTALHDWDDNRIEIAKSNLHSTEKNLRNWEYRWLVNRFDWNQVTFTQPRTELLCLAVDPSGRFVATGAGNKVITLRDAALGSVLRTLSGHEGPVNALAFSPDGWRLASGSDDSTLKIWDVASGKLLRSIAGHSAAITSLCWSPDGLNIVSGSRDRTKRVWASNTGAEMLYIGDHTKAVNSVAFDRDEIRVASGSDDGSVMIHDGHSGDLYRTLQSPFGAVRSIAFDPLGERIAAISARNTLIVWNSRSGAQLWQQRIPTPARDQEESLGVVRFSPDGLQLASADSEGMIRLWNAQDGEAITLFRGHPARVTDLTFDADGGRLFSVDEAGSLKIWDTRLEEAPVKIGDHAQAVRALAFSADEKHLASGGRDRLVRLYAMPSGRLVRTLGPTGEWINALGFVDQGKSLLVATHAGTIEVWDTTSGTRTKTIQAHEDAIHALAIDAESRHFATGGEDGKINVYDAKTLERVSQFTDVGGRIYTLAFSPLSDQCSTLAVAGDNFGVVFYDLVNGRMRTRITVPDKIATVAYLDKDQVVFGSHDGTVTFGDEQTRLLSDCGKHNDEVRSLVATAKRIFSAGNDNTIRIWDTQSTTELLTLRGHADSVLAVALSPGGDLLASADADGIVRLWDARSEIEGRDAIRLRERSRFDTDAHQAAFDRAMQGKQYHAALFHLDLLAAENASRRATLLQRRRTLLEEVPTTERWTLLEQVRTGGLHPQRGDNRRRWLPLMSQLLPEQELAVTWRASTLR